MLESRNGNGHYILLSSAILLVRALGSVPSDSNSWGNGSSSQSSSSHSLSTVSSRVEFPIGIANMHRTPCLTSLA